MIRNGPRCRDLSSLGKAQTQSTPKIPSGYGLPAHALSYHTHYDNKSPWLDEIPVHRVIKDNYAWWPIRMKSEDAQQRGIKHGDIVKVYNDRGAILVSRN